MVVEAEPAPDNVAGGGTVRPAHSPGEEEDRQHEDQGHQPGGDRHQPGGQGGPQPGRGDRVTDCQVAVSREDRQEEGAGHLVDAGRDHVEGAGEATEHPTLLDHGHHQEGNT